MTRKLKLLILSLLGFSAACSGVKNSTKSRAEEQPAAGQTEMQPDIRLMYGVRRPVPVAKLDTLEAAAPDRERTRRMADSTETQAVRSEKNHRIATMYGVRVPMENIDLDSLKRVEQERQQQAAADEKPEE